jgi:Holliday junction resolvase
MGKLESSIQRDIINHLERCGWYVVKLIQTNKNGIPDLLCISEGKCMFVEVKRPPARARPLQIHRINELMNHGVSAIVAHSIDDLKLIS